MITARGYVGWEYVHVAIDDHSRIAFSLVLPNEQDVSAAAFLDAALAYYARLGIHIRRLPCGPAFRLHLAKAGSWIHGCCFSRSTLEMGRSQWASRISNRCCSSRLNAA